MHITFIVWIEHGPPVNNIMWMCVLSLDVALYIVTSSTLSNETKVDKLLMVRHILYCYYWCIHCDVT